MDDGPIFLVGMPRSGTTLVFEAMAAHPDLAWLSQYVGRLPRLPVVARLSRLADRPRLRRWTGPSEGGGGALERLKPGPSEAYGAWRYCCGDRFTTDFLLGETATEAERRRARNLIAAVQRHHGRPRALIKVTGPGRIGYLTSIFGDARFVHVIRDGRAVVQSLLRVDFWRGTFRLDSPAWLGGLGERDIAQWEEHGRAPLALAAVEWNAVIRTIAGEAAALDPDRYLEIRYEDFVRSPDALLDRLLEFGRLRRSGRPHEQLPSAVRLEDMSFRWRQRFRPDEVATLEEIMGPTLDRLGYATPVGG